MQFDRIYRKNSKERTKKVVEALGKKTIQRIYDYSDVFHCEPIEKVANEFIEQYSISMGKFDNELTCEYEVPDYWTIGEVYERLIEDVSEDGDIIEKLMEAYTSWMDSYLSNYNIAVYYQSREYIAACYQEGKIL